MELSHHITERGNYRQLILRTDADYLQYLWWERGVPQVLP